MTKAGAISWSAVFLVLVPGTVAGLIPWSLTHWRIHPAPAGFADCRFLGVVMAACGAMIVLDSFWRFAIEGLGTPAPVKPPEKLVVNGFYRYVRNPMYVAALWLIFGQAMIFWSRSLIEYGVAVWIIAHVFVTLYEEPTLRKKFGVQYEAYCARAGRWIPRLRDRRSNDRV